MKGKVLLTLYFLLIGKEWTTGNIQIWEFMHCAAKGKKTAIAYTSCRSGGGGDEKMNKKYARNPPL